MQGGGDREFRCIQFLKYVPIYRKIHRIRIRYSKCQFIVQNTPRMPKYISIFTILGKLSISGVDNVRFGGAKNVQNTFNLCSHIELNTQNPNPILTISISFTKTPKTPKHFRFFGIYSEIEIFHFLFCIMYKLNNS